MNLKEGMTFNFSLYIGFCKFFTTTIFFYHKHLTHRFFANLEFCDSQIFFSTNNFFLDKKTNFL